MSEPYVLKMLTEGATTGPDIITVTEGLPKGVSLAEAWVDKPGRTLSLFFSEEQEGALVEQTITLQQDHEPHLRLLELDLIDKLTQDEGDELVIFAANPEPESDERNFAVQLQGTFYRKGRTFFGPTRLDCLQQALAYYEEHRP